MMNLPEWSRHTVLPRNVRALEESSSPSPLTDDDGGRQPSLYHAASRAASRRYTSRIAMEEARKDLVSIYFDMRGETKVMPYIRT